MLRKKKGSENSDVLEDRMIDLHHTPHQLSPNQCTSSLTQSIEAPLSLVWSIVRRFDHPQSYKQFIKTCTITSGDGGAAGSVREITTVSGMPAKRSTERLDRLDDEQHVMKFSMIGGDGRLKNYQSTITLHEAEDGKAAAGGGGAATIAIESYVVDVPGDSCKEDTCCFADAIIGYNLKSLARASENMARQLP